MVRGDPNLPLHARPFPRKVAQTGASRASHSAPRQRLPRLPVFRVWTMRPSMVRDLQDKGRERVDCSVGVDLQRDQGANQMSPPSAGPHGQDLCRVHFRESKAQQSTTHTMPVRWSQINAIWMSQSGILRCAWLWRDTIVKINVRKGHRNLLGTDRSKTRYMKVVSYLPFFYALNYP
jgi:hypothetical protein